MSPTPLPPNPFPKGLFYAAYNRCLALEAEAPDLERIDHCASPIISARLLGHLLRLAPAGNGQGQVQREINSAKGNTMLMQVAAVYLKDFIRTCFSTVKRSSGPTPAPSSHPSRPSFEDAREYALSLMEEGKLDHRAARTLVMHRDDKRCMLLGTQDYNEADGTAIVQAAHIIPESINTNRSQAAGMWAILSMFSRDNIINDLAGNHIHRLENIISMNSVSHQLFDELRLWLKPVEDTPHKYRVCVAKDSLRFCTNLPLPEYVTFSTATALPLPNHEYLALHALCCEVAWMSGAAEYIMDIARRVDDTKVLANDGSTADLLKVALSFAEVC